MVFREAIRDAEGALSKISFDFSSLRRAYEEEKLSPVSIIREAYRRIRQDDRSGIWISLRPEEDAVALAANVSGRPTSEKPLAGLPFAVKDNIDVAGLPTTAACPAYAYHPLHSAKAVAALEAAGAICIGKTNLDQFATGISGTRSPYGACGAAFDPSYVSGGSSSGSAVATALHQVAFALGTDTGGSGRVPAGLNGIVGIKPTIGLISTEGVVPNCRTLDCVAVLALAVPDAVEIAQIACGKDRHDLLLRESGDTDVAIRKAPDAFALVTPQASDLEFFGNDEGRALYEDALNGLTRLGAHIQPIDFGPLFEIGQLLFDGPWIAERVSSVGSFIEKNPTDVLQVTRDVIDRGRSWSANDVFEAFYRRQNVQAYVRDIFQSADAIVVPTVAPLYTIAELLANPIDKNNHNGHYSYFANILDLCAVSVPSGFYGRGMPFGITLLGPALHDARITGIAHAFHTSRRLPPGRPRSGESEVSVAQPARFGH